MLDDFNKKIKGLRQRVESQTLKMGVDLKDEFHFLMKRFRHKLCYQIGLTDDPWQPKNDFVMDDVYSQNPNDPHDLGFEKRAKSHERLGTVEVIHDEAAPQRVSSADTNFNAKHRPLVRRQRKYQ